MLNRIVLIGRLTGDPEERHTNSGTVLSRFRIAVNRIPRGRDGNDEADFFNVVCFGRTAEFVQRYVGRGDLVAVDGRCQIRDFEGRDGSRQRWVEVVADSVQRLTPRGEGGRGGRERDDDRGRDRDSGRRGEDVWEHEDDFAEEPPDDEAPAGRRRAQEDEPPSERGGRRRQFEPTAEATADEAGDDSYGGSYDDDDNDPFADG